MHVPHYPYQPGYNEKEPSHMYMLEHSWSEFDALRDTTDLLIQPSGAVEVYGLHLPAGTDTLVITHVARMVGERLGAPVLPTIPVGYSRSLGDFPGTLNISPGTLTAYLTESLESAVRWGFKRVLFLNSHRGNIGPVGEVAMELQERHGVRCAQVFWWDYVAALVKDIVQTGPHANGHASEIGTALMLHIAPDLVVRERMRDQTPSGPAAYADIIQYRGMRPRSDTGVVGNPTVANAEQGAEILRRGVDRIVAFVQEEFGG
jgi:creatinine amidohydrolase